MSQRMHAPSSDALAAILSSFEKLTLFIFARCSFIDAFSATVVYPPSGSVHTLTAPSVPPEMRVEPSLEISKADTPAGWQSSMVASNVPDFGE